MGKKVYAAGVELAKKSDVQGLATEADVQEISDIVSKIASCIRVAELDENGNLDWEHIIEQSEDPAHGDWFLLPRDKDLGTYVNGVFKKSKVDEYNKNWYNEYSDMNITTVPHNTRLISINSYNGTSGERYLRVGFIYVTQGNNDNGVSIYDRFPEIYTCSGECDYAKQLDLPYLSYGGKVATYDDLDSFLDADLAFTNFKQSAPIPNNNTMVVLDYGGTVKAPGDYDVRNSMSVSLVTRLIGGTTSTYSVGTPIDGCVHISKHGKTWEDITTGSVIGYVLYFDKSTKSLYKKDIKKLNQSGELDFTDYKIFDFSSLIITPITYTDLDDADYIVLQGLAVGTYSYRNPYRLYFSSSTDRYLDITNDLANNEIYIVKSFNNRSELVGGETIAYYYSYKISANKQTKQLCKTFIMYSSSTTNYWMQTYREVIATFIEGEYAEVQKYEMFGIKEYDYYKYYNKDDIVYFQDSTGTKLYRCIKDAPSDESPDIPEYWSVLAYDDFLEDYFVSHHFVMDTSITQISNVWGFDCAPRYIGIPTDQDEFVNKNYVDNLLVPVTGIPAFSTSSTYQIGDYVIYNEVGVGAFGIYKCKTANTTGAWDSAKWDSKTYTEYLQETLVGNALGGNY